MSIVSPLATRPPLWILLGIALAHFWRWGYAYGGGDHDEILPQVLHLLDGDLFSRDWFVQSQAEGVTVRTAFVWMLRVLCLALPLPIAVALVHVVVLLATIDGAYRLGFTLVPDRVGATLGAFAATVLVPHWTLGHNALTYNILVPEAVAWALALPAIRLFVEGRRLGAAGLLGLAGWFQALVGVQTTMVLGLVALWEALAERSPRQLGRAVAFGAVFALVAAPVFVPVLLTPPDPAAEAVARYSAFRVLAETRVPHHYLFLSFGWGNYVRFGLMAAAGLAALIALRRRGLLRSSRFVLRFLAVIAGVCVIAFALTEGMPVLFVAKLQLFKLTVLATTVLAILTAAWIATTLPERTRTLATRVLEMRRWGWTAVAGGAILTIALAAGGVGRPAAKFFPLTYARSDLAEVERWVRANTSAEALFLIPPSNTTFRIHARRSVVVNFKPTPYQEGAIHVWLDRLSAVAPAPLPERGGLAFARALDEAYAANDPADWARLAERFGAEFALVDARRTPRPPLGEPVVRVGNWAVYPLPAETP
jgi:hypothetical protein